MLRRRRRRLVFFEGLHDKATAVSTADDLIVSAAPLPALIKEQLAAMLRHGVAPTVVAMATTLEQVVAFATAENVHQETIALNEPVNKARHIIEQLQQPHRLPDELRLREEFNKCINDVRARMTFFFFCCVFDLDLDVDLDGFHQL